MRKIRFAVNMDESYKNSLGDGQIANSDSEDTESDGSDTLDELCLKSHQNMSHFFKTETLLNTNSTRIISKSSVNDSDSETDEDDFRPELFGLLDNPGVLRFGCLDYPLTVTEESDDNTAPERIRVSYDEIHLDNHTAWYDLVDGVNEDKTVSSSLEYISKCVNDEGRGEKYELSCQICRKNKFVL